MKKFKIVAKRLITLALLFTIIISQIPGDNKNEDPNASNPQSSSPFDKEKEK